jgi:hypothetical protein
VPDKARIAAAVIAGSYLSIDLLSLSWKKDSNQKI